jgi:hypothetical protein
VLKKPKAAFPTLPSLAQLRRRPQGLRGIAWQAVEMPHVFQTALQGLHLHYGRVGRVLLHRFDAVHAGVLAVVASLVAMIWPLPDLS